MPAYQLLINGTDLATYHAAVTGVKVVWGGPTVSYPEVAIPGTDGMTATSNERQLSARDAQVSVRFQTTTGSDFDDACDALKFAISGANVAIIMGNQTARQLTGYASSSEIDPDIDAQAGDLTFTLHCRVPLWVATSDTTVSGSSGSDHACALGTYRSFAVVTVTPGAGSFTLTYKNYAGATIAAPQFSGSGTSWVIDMGAKTITVDGTRHDEYLVADDFFALDPLDGDYNAGHFPTIATSAGSLSAVYAQRFL